MLFFILKRGGNMGTFQSELTEKGYAKTTDDLYLSKNKKSKEVLSKRELKELMGCNRATYARGKGGAYKQR